MSDERKIIHLPEPSSYPPSKQIKLQKEKEKRVVTKTNKWNFKDSDFTFENQYDIVQKIYDKKEEDFSMKFVLQELNKKLTGYKSQDRIKKLYDENKIIDIKNILLLLLECKFDCYYCKEKVNILYEPVREPTQWSLERLDNTYGHNKDNVVIACLSCNLRRKTMYHERFIFTKQMKTIKKIENNENLEK
jgi:hypothetical protein